MSKGEVVVALGVCSEDRIILSWCEINGSAALPPPNYTGSKKVGGDAILRSPVSDKLVEL